MATCDLCSLSTLPLLKWTCHFLCKRGKRKKVEAYIAVSSSHSTFCLSKGETSFGGFDITNLYFCWLDLKKKRNKGENKGRDQTKYSSFHRNKREKKEGKEERRCERKRDYERSGGAAMNIKTAIIKFYKKIRQILWYHELAKILQREHKSNNNKRKKCKLNSIKIKTFCSLKDIIKKIKSQITVREKIFVVHI